MSIPAEIRAQIDGIAGDRVSGATALVLGVVEVLRACAGDGVLLREVAGAVCRAQPAMAGFRTAAALALSSTDAARAMSALGERIRRAPASIARYAVPLIRLRRSAGPALTVVTCSRSETVERTLVALGEGQALTVCCAESGPAREGVGLAEALADRGIRVELYSDAGIGTAIAHSDALVVGADAVATTGYINKVGTAGLAALAVLQGIPVCVLAGREKILPAQVFQTLSLDRFLDGARRPQNQYLVCDPIFERVPAGLDGQVVTDGGVTTFEEIEAASLWSPSVYELYTRI